MRSQKRRMGHRAFSLLMTLALLAGVLWVPASAGGSGEGILSGACGENATWQLDLESGVLTISGTGEIEREIEGHNPVDERPIYKDAPWYDWRDWIDSIVIEKGITHIGSSVFSGCAVTQIGLPDGIVSIEESAFEGCALLTSIHLPDTLESIGRSAFSGCQSLKSVMIPKGVISFGIYQDSSGGIFENKSSVFSGCSSLTEIRVAAENKYFSSLDGVLFDKGYTSLICCPAAKNTRFLFPDNVQKIEKAAFQDCRFLKSVVLPMNMKLVESLAFFDCPNLIDITVLSDEVEIGYNAFGYWSVKPVTRAGFDAYIQPGVTIHCNERSTAQQYAIDNGIPYALFNALGDLDGDQEVTTADARLALRAAGQLETLTPQQQAAADVDYDGEVTPADARMILRAAAGLEASLALPPMAEFPEPGPDPDPGTDPDPVLPQSKAEVVQFYKLAAQKTADVERRQILTLADLYIDSMGQIIEPFRTSLENTLSENSGVSTGVPGDYEHLQASDVMSASVKKLDGSIEVTLKLKNFTSNGTMTGPVDHAMDIPQKIVETSIDRIKSPFSVSYDSVSYKHTNATLCVNINQETGQIESGTWDCEIQFLIENMKVVSNDVNCSGIIQNTIVMPAE